MIPWREAGLRFYAASFFYRRQFGERVWRVSLDARLGCPNRDGTISFDGCIFCNPASFSPSMQCRGQLQEQFARASQALKHRYGAEKFLAYFQPGTNTYGPPELLRKLWDEALSFPGVVGLIVGTRPDCLSDEVLEVLAEFSRRTWLQLELGLQSVHDRSLRWMNRGHTYEQFLDAVERCRQHGLRLGVHVILGIPGESPEDMLETAREIAKLSIESVKLHNLHVVRGTRLEHLWREGKVPIVRLDDYVDIVSAFLELLPPNTVVERLCGDAPPQYLLAPDWCRNKSLVRKLVEERLSARDSWQGKLWEKLCHKVGSDPQS